MLITPIQWDDLKIRIVRNQSNKTKMRLKVIRYNDDGINFRLCEKDEEEDHTGNAEFVNGKMLFEYIYKYKRRTEYITSDHIKLIKTLDFNPGNKKS